MNNYKQHIIHKVFTLILVASLLLPSAIKLNHAFEDHKHEVCITNSIDHFHELDLDCEFYKFNSTNQFHFISNYNNYFFKLDSESESFSFYSLINDNKPLRFSLRGPPYFLV